MGVQIELCLTSIQPAVTFENRPDWINHPAILVTILVNYLCYPLNLLYTEDIYGLFSTSTVAMGELARKDTWIHDIHACFA